MTKEEYVEKIKLHSKAFDDLWFQIVKDTNSFVDNQDEVVSSVYNLNKSIENFIDSLCLSGAWIQDRIEGYSTNPNNKKYRGSLTKKIRKALGYNT